MMARLLFQFNNIIWNCGSLSHYVSNYVTLIYIDILFVGKTWANLSLAMLKMIDFFAVIIIIMLKWPA